MSCGDRHIPQVIELAKFRDRDSIGPRARRRYRFSPCQALYYNDHPDAIIEDFCDGTCGGSCDAHAGWWAGQEAMRALLAATSLVRQAAA